MPKLQLEEKPLLDAYDDDEFIAKLESDELTTSFDLEKQTLFSVETENALNQSPRSFESPIPLPKGKLYHLFISFSSKDDHLVNPLVRELEDRHCLKCMFADRDFHGGKNIMTNITDTLQKSMKILIILTNNYHDSGPCMFEQEQAMHIFYLSERRKNALIPLMLTPCRVPGMLQTLTYIDAGKETDITARILEAFSSDDSVDVGFPALTDQDKAKENQKINGATICTVVASKLYKESEWRGAGWAFPPLTDIQKQHLHTVGAHNAEKVYEVLRKDLNSSLPFTCRTMTTFGRQAVIMTCLCCAFAAVIPIIVIGMVLFIQRIQLNMNYVTVATPLAAVLGILIWLIARFYFIRWGYERVLQMMSKHYDKFIKGERFFIFCDPDSLGTLEAKLLFIYYDVTQCELYLQNVIGKKIGCANSKILAEKARGMVRGRLQSFVRHPKKLLSLPNIAVGSRHATYMKKQCVCQIIEEEI